MAGILSGFGILSGRGVLSGKGVLSGDGVFPAPSDPVGDINFLLRLQTHRGDNVPFGLYQDTACTIPATAEGDPIGAWRDEFSGTTFIQSDNTKRMQLSFVGGVPVVTKTSDDDFLTSPLTVPDSFQYIVGADLVAALVFFRFGKIDLAMTGVLQISDTGVQAITSYAWAEGSDGHRVHSAKITKSASNVSATMYLDGTNKASGTVVQTGVTGDAAIAAADSSGSIPGYAVFSGIFLVADTTDEIRARIETYAAELKP